MQTKKFFILLLIVPVFLSTGQNNKQPVKEKPALIVPVIEPVDNSDVKSIILQQNQKADSLLDKIEKEINNSGTKQQVKIKPVIQYLPGEPCEPVIIRDTMYVVMTAEEKAALIEEIKQSLSVQEPAPVPEKKKKKKRWLKIF